MNQVVVKVVYRSDKSHYVLRWQDLETRAWRERSSRTDSKKEAEKLAAQLEADLQQGRFVEPSKTLWDEFRLAFEGEKLPAMALKTQQAYRVALDRVEGIIKPYKLVDLDSAALSRFQARLLEDGLRQASIEHYLRHLKSALNWAHDLGMLVKVPKVPKLKRARKVRQMRGRCVTDEEFNWMCDASLDVRPDDWKIWEEYLEGLWYSGLRLGESLQLGWDSDFPVSVNLAGKFPSLRITAEAEKGFQDRCHPITPDFAKFLERTDSKDRNGYVFGVAKLGLRVDTVSKIVSKIGREAGVVVNRSQKKFASAHDLRRSFGTRWASELKPIILQKLMRHESIETTLKYYVDQDAADISAIIWEAAESTGEQEE